MKRVRLIAVVLCTSFWAGAAMASWYDDYDAGLKALHDGQFQLVVQKMTAAIKTNPKEANNARTYGNIFINYHPYYYRAVAYINLGKYEQAVADLEITSGPGPIDRGSIESLMQEAKKKLAELSKPPEPTIDPALRNRAQASLADANAHIQSALQRKATGAREYQEAVQLYADTTTKLANAKSNEELNAVIATAGTVTRLADSAQPPPPPPIPLDPVLRNRAQASLAGANTHIQSAVQRKATGAKEYQSAVQRYAAADTRLATAKSNDDLNAVIAEAGIIIGLADSARAAPPLLDDRLRRAFESYFRGDFDEATRDFQSLSNEMPKNGWIWAFLGASQYSQYAFSAQETYKASAISSFRKAKQFGKWKGGTLPEKYFSRKIRKAFNESAG